MKIIILNTRQHRIEQLAKELVDHYTNKNMAQLNSETKDASTSELKHIVSGSVLTEEDILDYVRHHNDGFEYAQLQTGISKKELLKLLYKYGFEQCNKCVNWEEGLYKSLNKHLCSACYENEINIWT